MKQLCELGRRHSIEIISLDLFLAQGGIPQPPLPRHLFPEGPILVAAA